MKTRILTGALLLFVSASLSAQFVGEGTPAPASTAPAVSMKGSFFIKFGGAMPIGDYGTIPQRGTPQYSAGIMGAKTGFFAEIGMGMSLTNPDKMVGFYYIPILASFWQTSLDWSELGGFFADKAIYTKPVSAIDIGQRYGVVIKPIKNLFVALYYRPGLLIPLDFEINHESFQFTGTMSTADDAPIFMMSHAPGLSVRYMFATLSFEGYFARPTYEVHYKDADVIPNVDVTDPKIRIPVKMLLVSLGASF